MNTLTEDFPSSLNFLDSEVNPKFLSNLCKDYELQIKELSSKLFQADSLVKNLLASQEKLKNLLSCARVENSNLVLMNRKLRSQLNSLKIASDSEKLEDGLVESLKDLKNFQSPCPRCANDSDVTRMTTTQLSIEKGKSFKVRSRRRMKMDFCIVEHQYEICVLGRKRKKVRFANECFFEVSRTFNTGVWVKKPVRKIRFQGTLSVRPSQGKRIDLKFQNLSNFSNVSKPEFVELGFNSGERIMVKPARRLKKLEICNGPKIFMRPAGSVRKVTGRVNLSVFRFPIFVNQLGRSQIEKLDDDDNNLDLVIPRRAFNLKISRTVKSAYVPKVRKFFIQKQESLLVSSMRKKEEKGKGKKFDVTRSQVFELRPFKAKITFQRFTVFQGKLGKIDKALFNVFSFKSELLVKKVKGFAIFPEEYEFSEGSIDSASEKGRKSRRTNKRASAIEEYFTLVIKIQTFQAVKLNFVEKDKIYMIKSADLYSKVQQLKLPFNFWHDWIKEQFNFLCTNK
jgi:hypothetical protein